MKFVFGGFLVCDTPETAKKVTFHPDVRVRSVTKGGDLYDPSGLLTGGSAPKGGNILQQLQELADLEEKAQKMHNTITKHAAERERMRSSAAKYSELERTLQCKEHELELCNERIKGSEHHAATEEVQSMKEKAQLLESELEALPEEKKKLTKDIKQLEKDIKSFDSSREDGLEKLIKHI
jgi:structural maintenance of chromosome 2